MTPLDPMDPIDPKDAVLQRALRRALKSVEPPPGFAARVLQHAAAKGTPDRREHQMAFLRLAPVRWAVAATLVAAAGGGFWYRAEEQRRAQGEEARRQVLLSLSIAGSKLRSVQMQVNQVNQVNQRRER
jgi:hypothetical protein